MFGRLRVLSSNEIRVLDYLVPPAVSVRIWLAQLSLQLMLEMNIVMFVLRTLKNMVMMIIDDDLVTQAMARTE